MVGPGEVEQGREDLDGLLDGLCGGQLDDAPEQVVEGESEYEAEARGGEADHGSAASLEREDGVEAGCECGPGDGRGGGQRDDRPDELADGGDAAVEPPVDAVADAELTDGLGVEQDVGVDLTGGGRGGGEADEDHGGAVADARLGDHQDEREEGGADPERELRGLCGAVLGEGGGVSGKGDGRDRCRGDDEGEAGCSERWFVRDGWCVVADGVAHWRGYGRAELRSSEQPRRRGPIQTPL